MRTEHLTDDQIASTLPDGLRDRVMVQAQRRTVARSGLSREGELAASQFECARLGIPWDAEQDARWRRLGIHPDQQ
jgi:hypothetical protein